MIHPEFTPQHSSTPREFLVARDSRITNDGHDGIDFDKFKFDTPTGDAFMSEIRHRVTQHQVATGGTPDQHQCVIDVRDVMCSVLRTQGFRALPDFIATLHPVFPAGDMQRQDDLVLTTEERLGVLARRLQQGVGTGAVPVGTDQPGWTWSPGLATHERQSVLNEGQQQRASGGGGIPYPSAGFAVGTVYNPPGPGYNSYGATYNTNGQVTNHQSPSLPPPPPPPARQPPPDHPPPPNRRGHGGMSLLSAEAACIVPKHSNMSDMLAVMSRVTAAYPTARGVYVIGFSAGANLCINYLATEHGRSTVTAAAAVSNGYDIFNSGVPRDRRVQVMQQRVRYF